LFGKAIYAESLKRTKIKSILNFPYGIYFAVYESRIIEQANLKVKADELIYAYKNVYILLPDY
jgi:hypothetical protein